MTLELWNKVRSVPETAKKKITGGRLNGFTDINPVYRLKVLTEQFGPCGMGWYYEITDRWIECGANDEKAAFVNINLYTNDPSSGWSKPIAGTGGSMLVAKEIKGLYTSDECFKMALTDALSVACKALGIGADVYWDKDSTKYPTTPQTATATPTDKPQQNAPTGKTDNKPPEKSSTGYRPTQAITTNPPNVSTSVQPHEIAVSNPSLSDKVSKADLAPIIEECKKDNGQLVRFRNLYKAKGYSRAEDILKSDWQKLLDEFYDTALPFELGV